MLLSLNLLHYREHDKRFISLLNATQKEKNYHPRIVVNTNK